MKKTGNILTSAFGIVLLALVLMGSPMRGLAQPTGTPQTTQTSAVAENDGQKTVADSAATMMTGADSVAVDSALLQGVANDETPLKADEGTGLHHALKKKFIEGNAGFMSLVALALVLGLAFSIERIIYLTLSEIDARRFADDLSRLVDEGQMDEARELCRNTRGPVASVCYQGLLRADEPMEAIERSVESYGSVQASLLEKGCSWIRLFIGMAPSLGFLGTVIGMVMAFENIELAGDLNASVVAEGMKVALITTVFGIIVALILQLFYNYINTKIDRLVAQMEETSITLLDAIGRRKSAHQTNVNA